IAPHEAWYVVCPPEREAARAILDEFRPIFESESIIKIGHNLKYDISLLKWNGIDVRGPLFDTMLAHTVLEPEMRHGLDYLAKRYLNYTPIPIEALIGERGGEQRDMRSIPVDQLAEYGAEDADVTWQIAAALRPELEHQQLEQVCNEIECPLVAVL